MSCFTLGTAIATFEGERAVEDLAPGDRVVTRDHGVQEVRWVGRRTIGADRIAAKKLETEAAPPASPAAPASPPRPATRN